MVKTKSREKEVIVLVWSDYGEKRKVPFTSFSPPGSCGFSLPQGFPSCSRTAPSFRDSDKEKAKDREKIKEERGKKKRQAKYFCSIIQR